MASLQHNQRGFSFLELVTVIAIISVLVAVALRKYLPYVDEAERVSVIRVEGQLRSSLVMEAAKRVVRGRSATIQELEGANPLNLLADLPKNYVGELPPDAVAGAPSRHWYFDTGSKLLVYRLGEPYALATVDETHEDPAFAVRVAYADLDGDGQFEASRDEFYGVRLERVGGTSWLSGMTGNY
jgi:prepilin-type N-terminal cleavage/methylation domain-containing protein